jgi:O-antigen/teichoic acid export membrane protein
MRWTHKERAIGGGSIVLVLGVVVTAAMNYGFGVALAWMMPPEQFGAVSVLMSVLLLAATVLAAGFPWSLARTVAKADGIGQAARAQADPTFRAAVLGNVGVGVLLATAFVTIQMSTGLILPGAGWGLSLLIGVIIVAVSLSSVLWGALQGARRFDGISLTQLIQTVTKVGVGLGLVALIGYGVDGVAVALLASAIAGVLWAAHCLRDRWPGWGSIKGGAASFAEAVPMAIGTTSFGLLTLDVLLLSPLGHDHGVSLAVVGVYQAAAVLARAPILLSDALSDATFTFIAKARTNREAHGSFMNTFRWVPLVFVPLQLVLLVAPDAVLGVVFPTGYAQAGDLARLITVGTTGLVVTDMLRKALFARGQARSVAMATPIGVVTQLLALIILVPRLGAPGAALSFTAGAWVTAGLLASVYIRTHRPSRLRMRTAVAWIAAAGSLALVLLAATATPRPLDLVVITGALVAYGALAVRLRLVPERDVAAVRDRLSQTLARRSPSEA